MPQMSPLNWLILFLFFSMIFIIFNILNYFILNYSNPSMTEKSFSFKPLNWKW
uniref:ATP synthase complex subunit 8 n=1 Tax=Archichauliodes deceptor TaxID=1909206 RepID=A0A343A2U5_9NEOP|nr:ATP synthase F0 subunit 8 [Archichauliodes deceptor]AOX48539.1 ATP synthase F0 subunit 8 [Archichauliodes deceptor]